MADDVQRLIEEREGHDLMGVWDVRSVNRDRLVVLRVRHATEYVYAADHDRVVAEKDARIAELEQERSCWRRTDERRAKVWAQCESDLAERTRERDEARDALKAWEAAARSGASTLTGGTR